MVNGLSIVMCGFLVFMSAFFTMAIILVYSSLSALFGDAMWIKLIITLFVIGFGIVIVGGLKSIISE